MRTLDLAPIDPLQGRHYKGTVEHRFLADYPLAPRILAPLVPEDAELCLHKGKAWLSACFVQIRHMRPSFLPRPVGVPFRYLVHRTLARVPFPDGQYRKAVLILEAYADNPLVVGLGRTLVGAPFRQATLDLRQRNGRFRVRMTRHGRLAYDATLRPGNMSRAFGTLEDADRFLLGTAWGSHKTDQGAWRLFPETHAAWNLGCMRAETHRYALLETLGHPSEADHVLSMHDVPHAFGPAILVWPQKAAQAVPA